jgi:threonine aldolase
LHQLSGICKSQASAARPVRVHCPAQTRPPEAPLNQPKIDLRSDTVTRPTAAMRRAMAEAEVGDDVFGDDSTTQALERRVAELAGKAAALFVPSGTMGNQLAVHGHTTPGDEVLLDAMSHIAMYEQGGMAANSGAMPRMVQSERGVMPATAIAETIRDHSDDHVSRLALVCLENTHNRHGGAVVPLNRVQAVSAAARERGLRVHLDGARLWNAEAATGIPIRDWAAHADSLMMCFSKGLGAPIGSILVGDVDFIRRARRVRKRWGGGMRQVGILAAAALHALDHHRERLREDHARARTLAANLAAAPGVTVRVPETNIVFADLEHPALERDRVRDAMARRGVLVWPFGPRRLRLMTHLDVSDQDVQAASAAFLETIEEAIPRPTARR